MSLLALFDHKGCPTAKFVGGEAKYICMCHIPCNTAQQVQNLQNKKDMQDMFAILSKHKG